MPKVSPSRSKSSTPASKTSKSATVFFEVVRKSARPVGTTPTGPFPACTKVPVPEQEAPVPL
ncbi:MAG TPA: hypothetical protein DCS15_01180 [Flavobacteriales bacterium]|nr:hypothetical protein [Flavobacteriales bacterium]